MHHPGLHSRLGASGAIFMSAVLHQARPNSRDRRSATSSSPCRCRRTTSRRGSGSATPAQPKGVPCFVVEHERMRARR